MIKLYLKQPYYEQDIRPLLMSFFPGEPIHAYIGDEEQDAAEEIRAALCIDYQPEGADIVWTDETQEIREKTAPMDLTDHKESKNIIKRAVYQLLGRITGRELPWGSLTGIRPTKIAVSMLEAGADEAEIMEHYRQEYFCSDKKAELSIDIARRELDILKNIDYENGYSIYIGIPFCPTTCLYCSFTSYPIGRWKKRVDEYLDCVFKEIDYVAEAFADRKLNTIYIGGGTPTTLEAEQLERLIVKLKESFDFTDLQEFTVEAGRPDSITRDKLEVIKRQGISRISINPQTMKDATLKIIGRQHTVDQIRQVYALAREVGLDNINMDIILGLPDETIEDVELTMQELSKLAPDSITVHSLAVKRAARLNTSKEDYTGYRMENTEDMMDLTREYTGRLGLEPYYLYRQKNMSGNLENVGYAAPGKAGIYNILIMEEKQTIVAMGAGATTKAVFGERLERCENVKDIDNYISRIDEMIERKKTLFADKKD